MSVRLEEVGLQCEGAVQVGDRLVVAARIGQDLPEAVVRVGLIGCHELILLQVLDRLLVVSAVAVVVTDLVVSVGVVGLDRQQLGEDLERALGMARRDLVSGQDLRCADVLGVLFPDLSGDRDDNVPFRLHGRALHVHVQAFPLGHPVPLPPGSLDQRNRLVVVRPPRQPEQGLGKVRIERDGLCEADPGLLEVEAALVLQGLLVGMVGRFGGSRHVPPAAQIERRQAACGEQEENADDGDRPPRSVAHQLMIRPERRRVSVPV